MKAGLNQNDLLAQMQKLGEMAKAGGNQPAQKVAGATNGDNAAFGDLLTKAVNTVNQYQMESGQAARQVEAGDGGASLVKAVIASQKASVAFQATVQVRNRVVSAYQDIMNMPI
ncbi:flagellar hook-basal body complex protein FliE [Aliikangiella coralliicola]|uniref:Flagellar hook-basal body complex protein FliE n=1 Tax=Aliikangiella coralliicola TaxID=2592383 RepID=A0A545UB78_9GAMM|nr:flagellar hook-basal body complex protein FliE [Aliikangiella coralliicola]TQV86726.1 flagellar hook-basal body complex protein FliE [Aliikangiella coralliicola]